MNKKATFCKHLKCIFLNEISGCLKHELSKSMLLSKRYAGSNIEFFSATISNVGLCGGSLTGSGHWSYAHGHDDVIKRKHFPRYWPFVWGIHRAPVNSPHKGQWRGALMFPLICAWANGWVNSREAGGLRGHRAHYDIPVMNQLLDRQISHTKIEKFKTLIISLLLAWTCL